MTPLVSVIITTYNSASTLKRAVYSILTQSHAHLELWVVNDASTDCTLELLKEVNDPRLKVLHNPTNAGTYYCKNIALQKVQGSYITFQDADDLSDPYRIEKCLSAMYHQPQLKLTRVNYLRFQKESQQIIWRPYLQAVQTLFLKREVLQEIGFFDKARHSADTEYLKRAEAFYTREQLGRVPEFLYFAEQGHAGQITAQIDLQSKERLAYQKAYAEKHKAGNFYVDFPWALPALPGQVEVLRPAAKEPKYLANPARPKAKESAKQIEAWQIKLQNTLRGFHQQIALKLALSAQSSPK